MEDLRERLIPSDVQVTVTRDYGATSAEKAQELLTHLILAILTVTLVIAFFLGWRGGLVVRIRRFDRPTRGSRRTMDWRLTWLRPASGPARRPEPT